MTSKPVRFPDEQQRPPVAWWTDGVVWSGDPPGDIRGVLPGSFNPLHAGHLRLQAVAADLLGGPVAFELTAVNADKPPLTETELRRRCGQFCGRPVAVTVAATFVEKSRLFPGTTFVVGADTALRVLQPRFYEDSAAAMERALGEIAGNRCGFLVAARRWGLRLWTLEDLDLPAGHADMFRAIPPERFRLDISSTDLRRQSSFESPSESPGGTGSRGS